VREATPLPRRVLLALGLALGLGAVALPYPAAARNVSPVRVLAGTESATALPTGTPTPTPQPTPAPTPSPRPVGGGQGTGGEGSCPVGQWGFAFWPSPICIDIQGFLSAVAAAITQPFRALAEAMLAGVDALLTGTPNFATEAGWADLQGFFDYLNTLAKGLFVAFFLIAAFRYLLTSLGGDSAYEAIGALRRGFVGLLVLQALPWALGQYFTLLGAVATYINGYTGHGLTNQTAETLMTFVEASFGASVVATGGTTVLFFALFLLVVLLCAIAYLGLICLTRLGGLFLLAALYVTAPLALVCWVSPDFKRIAHWWFESFIGVSLWGIGYAITLKVLQILLVGFSAMAPYNTPFIKPLMGLAGLIVLYRVPRIVGACLGGATGQASGALVAADTVVSLASTRGRRDSEATRP